MTDFNIFSQLQSELDDFYNTKIKIGGAGNDKTKGYEFSQAETLNDIQFVGGSKFRKGDKDGKVYLNSSVFRADVASKQIDIDVANIKFQPVELHDKNITILKRRRFKQWAKEIGFSVELNDMVEKYPFWGHLVSKKIKGGYELVPLTKLRNQQDAKDLNSASYVIIEHVMEAWEVQAMPDWDLSGLEYKWDDRLTVYERYGRVPAKYFDPNADETESVDTISYIIPDGKDKKKDGSLLFIEKLNKRPFKEVKWKNIDDRWLGMGEIENNFDNQKARNAVFNLRLRSALWASKNIFQAQDPEVARNLVTEVHDGEVIIVNDGGIVPINTQTQALGDFNALDEVIEGNADQKSFTYEVATGEQLNSGTPFRLGVVLSNSVNNHFGLKREKLALFLKEILYEDVLINFNKENRKKHTLMMASGEEGYNELYDIYNSLKINEFILKYIKQNMRVPSPIEVERFRTKMSKDFEVDIEENAYDIKDSIDIAITGEAVDVESKMVTLSSVYQLLVQKQDPRADIVLDKILLLTDEQLPKSQGDVAGLQAGNPQSSLQSLMQQATQPQQNAETI